MRAADDRDLLDALGLALRVRTAALASGSGADVCECSQDRTGVSVRVRPAPSRHRTSRRRPRSPRRPHRWPAGRSRCRREPRFANVMVLGFSVAPDGLPGDRGRERRRCPASSRPRAGARRGAGARDEALGLGDRVAHRWCRHSTVHDVLLVFAVVVDGCVLMSLSAGLIFTLPVMLQLTVPVALPSATLPADAGLATAAKPPSASAAAEAVSTIFRSMLSPLGWFRVSPLTLEADRAHRGLIRREAGSSPRRAR